MAIKLACGEIYAILDSLDDSKLLAIIHPNKKTSEKINNN